MSYLLRAHLIQRIADGPVNQVTGFKTPTTPPVESVTKTIEEWDGTINTVTVTVPDHDLYQGRTVIEYADGVRYVVEAAYLDSITVTTKQ